MSRAGRARNARDTWVPLVVLAVVTLATVWLRLRQASESLWLDELHTAWVAMGAWASIGAHSLVGNQSPVFFALEWALVHSVGASELTLRLPSIVAGGLLVVALFAMARAWTGSAWLALVPAWLAAVDPQAIYYGTEARPYALVQLLGLLHVANFAALVRTPTRGRRILGVAGAAVLFHLHYTAALLFAGELAWYAWMRARGRTAYAARAIALDAAITTLLMAPAAPALAAIFARRANWAKFVGQPEPWVAVAMLPWAASALVGAALVAVWRRANPANAAEAEDQIHCAVCWLAVPLVIAWAATTSDVARLLWPRYMAASAPAALILLVLALRDIPGRRLRAVAAVAVLVAGTVGSYAVRHFAATGRLLDWRADDWRDAVTWFNEHPRHAAGAVLLRSDLIETDALGPGSDSLLESYARYPLQALYGPVVNAERLVALRRNQPDLITDSVADVVDRSDAAWLVYNGGMTQEMRAAEAICHTLGERSGHSWAVVTTRSFGTVHVTLLGR